MYAKQYKEKKKRRRRRGKLPESENGIVVYTDGGCAVNPGGPGGYGVVVIDKSNGQIKEYSAGYVSTTNNRMEIMGVIRALKETSGNITIVSDSQYTINCATGIWSRNKNRDLWAKFEQEAKDRSLRFEWVQGHRGNKYNEKCDELATEAMLSSNLMEDTGYLQAKRDGAKFYAEMEEKGKSSPAMAVLIDIPDELDILPEFTSNAEYARDHNIHKRCAADIQEFYLVGDRSFKAYLSIKTGGIDYWSKESVYKMIDIVPDGIWDIIQEHFENEAQQKTCLRWCCRGLALSDAIRKVLVDTEASKNYERKN